MEQIGSALPQLPRPAPQRPRLYTPPVDNAAPRDTVEIDAGGAELRSQSLRQLNLGQTQNYWDRGPGSILLERDKPKATMAVVDTFGLTRGFDGQLQPTHGEITAALAEQASGQGEPNLLRVETGPHSPTPVMDPSSPDFAQQLDRHTIALYTSEMDQSSDALRAIQRTHPEVNTINQSQGRGAPSITGWTLNEARRDPAFGAALARRLGLPEGTGWSKPEDAVEVARYVQSTLRQSPEARQANEGFAQQLSAMGPNVRYFNAAGNDGALQAGLAAAGFHFDPQWSGTGQHLAAGTTTVGAGVPVQLGGRNGAAQAPYSQMTQTDVLGDGEGRALFQGQAVCTVDPMLPGLCLPGLGTSYASPRVAGAYNRNPAAFDRRLREQALPPLSILDPAAPQGPLLSVVR